MGGLYKLSVGITLKDATQGGFAEIERNARAATKNTEALRNSLNALGKGFDPQHSLASQMKLNEYTEKQVALRKQMALSTDVEEQKRIAVELKALDLAKQEETVRKRQISLQEQLGKIQDKNAYQAQASQEKLEQQAIRNQEKVAEVTLRNEKSLAQSAYQAQVAQERRDLQAIKTVADAKRKALRDQERAQQKAQQDALREQARSNAALRSSLGFVGGMAAGAASGAILGGLRQGTNSAADMQMALTTLQTATGADPAQLESLRGVAFDIADKTAQSATDAAKNLSVLAASGLNDPRQLRELATPIAQFADVQYYKSGTSFQESAKQGVQLAHLFQAYTADKMKPILEQLTKISFAMPDNLNRFLTQAGYYEPVFKGLGVKDSDALEAGAIIDRAGLGRGKGGTALQNLLLNEMNSLALTKHVQGKRSAALQLLGLSNKDGSSRFYNWNEKDHRNEFDVIGALQQIDKSVKNIPSGLSGPAAAKWQAQRIMAVNAALGLTGERAALAISKDSIDNLTDALKRIGKSGDMSNIQTRYMGTLGAQEQRFKSNMDSLLTDLMWPWLDKLRVGFQWMGDEAHTIQKWMHTHKEAAETISAGLLGIGLALAWYSTTKLWGIATGIAGLSQAIRSLGSNTLVAETEIGVGASTLSKSMGFIGLLGKGGIIFSALEYFIDDVIPKYTAYDKAHVQHSKDITGGVAPKLSVERGGTPLFDPKSKTLGDEIADGLSTYGKHFKELNPWLFPLTNQEKSGIHFHAPVTFLLQGNTTKAQAQDFYNQLQSGNVQSALRTGNGQPGPTLARAGLLH